MLRKWEDLPAFMQSEEVYPYWEYLWKKRGQLVLKRVFDLFAGIVLLILLTIPMVFISILIKKEDSGPVFYSQERVTTYGRHFRIHKFRTMVCNADQIGSTVTAGDDFRITRIGKKLRQLRLDELPQLFDVIAGDMSLVGTRPEVVKYFDQYKPIYYATLLLPAGITSEASIRFKNEAELLKTASDIDKKYIEEILPEKMKLNLKSISDYCFFRDIEIMFRTVFSMLGKE